jgi:hypothetical protein
MLNRTILAVAAVASVVATNAFARFPDSYTDLDPRVRAEEQARYAQSAPSVQGKSDSTPSTYQQIDRASPL